ncbi:MULTISPECIES: DMT family transporter [unclassified Leptolyngbya]|uniref:DMT family transporter n=1 Tax=unclassified Leptolyngbya TaxID=2650499 RepID=UPI001681FBA7|nr:MULTISPECIES: DMT family transporter [unclassified Leptolyngbya]MBD1910812.1 EamA family transporter [Leptolyngbya sp. FACHB-8]MBD2157619.1 EamA family transporter [Leptolyngbya sp. FACHB-16]
MQLFGIILIILSATSFGAIPIFAHFAYASGATPLTVLFFRFAIAAVCFCTYLVIRQIPLPNPKNLRTLILLGGVGFVLQSLSFFFALTVASPGLVVLLLYLYPTIVVGISIVVLHRPSSPGTLWALSLALLGTVLTIGPVGNAQLLGVILGLVSACIYATYILVGEQVMTQESPITASTVVLTSAAVVYGGIVTIRGVSLPQDASGWLAIGALGLISTVVAIGALFTGIKLLGASTASMLSTLEPVVTIALSLVILKQPITGMQLVGGALILLAVIFLTVRKTAHDKSERDSYIEPQ